MQHACKGRWAAEYGHNQNLTFEEMDRVLTKAKEQAKRQELEWGEKVKNRDRGLER